jgi:hypothetical protein
VKTKGFPYRKRWKRLLRKIARARAKHIFNPHQPKYWWLINQVALLNKHKDGVYGTPQL